MKHPSALALSVMLAFTFLPGCKESGEIPSSTSRDGGEGTIVAFGDSLSEGYLVETSQAYPARLEVKLRADGYRYRVVNRGWSGETSGETLARVHEIIRLKPDIVILETGANDGFIGYPPERIGQNIEETIRLLRREGIVVVLGGMRMTPFLRGPRAEAFDAIYPDLARKHDLILIPFFLQGVAGRTGLVQFDGVHPTAEGYRVLTDQIYPYILDAIERQRQARAGGG